MLWPHFANVVGLVGVDVKGQWCTRFFWNSRFFCDCRRGLRSLHCSGRVAVGTIGLIVVVNYSARSMQVRVCLFRAVRFSHLAFTALGIIADVAIADVLFMYS